MYLYRAVDKQGKTVESYLSRTRDVTAAKAFFRKALKRAIASSRAVPEAPGFKSPLGEPSPDGLARCELEQTRFQNHSRCR